MKKLIITLMLFAAPVFAETTEQQEPAVKMSTSGVCHSEDSQYYARTKNYTSYDSIAECVEAGGRLPR